MIEQPTSAPIKARRCRGALSGRARVRAFLRACVAGALLVAGAAGVPAATGAERPSRSIGSPTIEVTGVPGPGGGENDFGTVSGRVKGVDGRGLRVVIYSLTDVWYVQPWIASPFTSIGADGRFGVEIHKGREYAVLLVMPAFAARATLGALPAAGGPVIAVVRRLAR